jgi:hypothetical protein
MCRKQGARPAGRSPISYFVGARFTVNVHREQHAVPYLRPLGIHVPKKQKRPG